MDSPSSYIKYIKGLNKRVKYIGFKSMLSEYWNYYRKYVKLPSQMGFKEDFNYKLFVIYNYIKITYYLWDESDDYIMNFVPRRIQKFLLPRINPLNKKYIVVDKTEFYRLCQSNSLPIPKTHFYTKEGVIYKLSGEKIDKNELRPLESQTFFSKIIDGSAAIGAQKKPFSINDLNLFENRLYQEALTTHNEIINLSPTKALNCIKISTYLSNDGFVKVQLSFLKLGSENSIVDNIGGKSGGGIAIAIDHNTGKLKNIGYKEVGKQLRVTKIPSNNKTFGNFVIPYYQESISLVKEAHLNVFHALKHIGWDVGITNDGPVLIEANSGADLFAAQMICRPFTYYNDVLIQENILINE